MRVEIDRDPLAIGERIGLDVDDPPPCGEPPVERVELGRDGGEVVARIDGASSRSRFESEPLAATGSGDELARRR